MAGRGSVGVGGSGISWYQFQLWCNEPSILDQGGDLALRTSSIWWTQWQAEDDGDSLPSYVKTEKSLSSTKEPHFCILDPSIEEKRLQGSRIGKPEKITYPFLLYLTEYLRRLVVETLDLFPLWLVTISSKPRQCVSHLVTQTQTPFDPIVNWWTLD